VKSFIKIKDRFLDLINLFSWDIGIDLGTNNTLIYLKDRGIVIDEPTMIARQKKKRWTGLSAPKLKDLRPVAYGLKAKMMWNREPKQIEVISPLKNGIISDLEGLESLMAYYLKLVYEVPSKYPKIFKPNVVVGVPSSINQVQKRAIRSVMISAGARRVTLVEEVVLAALGVNLPIDTAGGLVVVDVQSRVFSTLGQPNWLAAYLCILLPLSLFNFLESKIFIHKSYFLLLTSSLYTCLLFTKSKSGILASIISLTIFFIIKIIKDLKDKVLFLNIKSYIIFLIFLLSSILVNNPIKDILFPPKTEISNLRSDILVTPSSDIRKIVWQGSLDLFKQFPLFGTGVETFAYSYYWTRASTHNLTSEWDFLYNKAHNEYLNYLATTGLVGFIPYLVLIIVVLFLLIKNLIRNSNPARPTGGLDIKTLSIALLSSYISILITNGFGFSVVIVSLYFFLIPTLAGDSIPNHPTLNHPKLKKFIPILFVLFIILTKNIIFSYVADIYLAKFESSNGRQEYQQAYQNISKSISLRPNDPNYLISLATAAAKMAVITKEQSYIDQTINSSAQAIKISPANINYLKQQAQAYYYLATIDTQYFIKTVESMLQANKLAPTDAKILYSLGQFLESADLIDDAIYYYQKDSK